MILQTIRQKIPMTKLGYTWKNRLTFINCSRISQLNIPGLSFLYSSILFSTSGVATRGFEPPMTPGLMDPVSWYLLSIFDTQPWLTLNWREITQGRTPAAAISIIFNLTWLGRGRPLMKTPPSWLTRPWPRKKNINCHKNQIGWKHFWSLSNMNFSMTFNAQCCTFYQAFT